MEKHIQRFKNPDDGYRSCMEEIKKSDVKIINIFKPCKVIGTMDTVNDIINFVDIYTNKVVLSIGTDHSDQWYPYWVAEFVPENMVINQQLTKEVLQFLTEIYSDLKDEIQDNGLCQIVGSKKLVEIVNRLHDFVEICRSSVQ